MKNFIFLFIFLTTSCASYKNFRTVSENELDGLRFESLNRYNTSRLKNSNLLNKPIVMCHAGHFQKAYDHFKKQLDLKKNDPTYWNNIGTCHLLELKLSRAKFYFDLALSRTKSPQSKAIVLNNIGIYYLKLNQAYLAKDAFEKAITLHDSYKTPKYNLIQILLRFSQFDRASKLLAKLLESSPNDIDFIYSMGHLKLMQGQFTEATKYFSLIPKKYLTRDDIATNYAMSLYFSGNISLAYSIVKQADMNSSHFLIAQTELIKKIERINQKK